jgi:hypothetical protein
MKSECVFCGEYVEWGDEYRKHMEEHYDEYDAV